MLHIISLADERVASINLIEKLKGAGLTRRLILKQRILVAAALNRNKEFIWTIFKVISKCLLQRNRLF